MAQVLVAMMRELGFERFSVPRAARTVSGAADRRRTLDCGHFLAEERPEEVVDELRSFLGESS